MIRYKIKPFGQKAIKKYFNNEEEVMNFIRDTFHNGIKYFKITKKQ